jgi:hypothetical protein
VYCTICTVFGDVSNAKQAALGTLRYSCRAALSVTCLIVAVSRLTALPYWAGQGSAVHPSEWQLRALTNGLAAVWLASVSGWLLKGLDYLKYAILSALSQLDYRAMPCCGQV